MSNLNSKPWPKLTDYPFTESGWNHYANDWVARSRMAGGVGQIPKTALEEHWEAMQQGRDNGWQEYE